MIVNGAGLVGAGMKDGSRKAATVSERWDMEGAALDGAMLGLVIGDVLMVVWIVYVWLQ